MALMQVRGELAVGEPFTHYSLLGTEFACSIEALTTVGGIGAVTTRVGGRAWLTGVSCYGTDPEDPFPHGYRLNDTWFAC
jgi:proline racemase